MNDFKISIQLILFSLYCFLNSTIALAADVTPRRTEGNADFRLVITGGLLGLHDGERAFYGSPLFRLGDVADNELGSFVIENAELKSFQARDTLYFSFDAFDANLIINAASSPKIAHDVVQGMMGSQIFGFALNSDNTLTKMQDSLLRRELSGIYGNFKWEMRRVGDVRILAVDISDDEIGVYWPKSVEEIEEMAAVVGLYADAGKKFVFFPRQTASTSRTFGVVDRLLDQKNAVPTRYLDIGNALVSSDDESMEMARQMSQLLSARNPAVLGATRYDLSAMFSDQELVRGKPYIVALKGESLPPSSQVVAFGSKKVQFSALGEISETALGFLPKGVSSLNIAESIKQAQLTASQADLVIGLTDNNESAGTAIASPVFDAVLSLVSGARGALPARDDIDLKANHLEGLGSVAPLVRVSSADVTEVLIWMDTQGRIDRLEIKRHALVDDGFEASDAKRVLDGWQEKEAMSEVGLPQKPTEKVVRAWAQSDYDSILGGILLQSRPGTELAIIDQNQAPTPIYSPIPSRLAQSLLQRPGRAVWLSLRGKYIKRMLKAAKEKQFDVPVTLVGGSFKGPTIGQREIIDTESYRVVVTERVLVAIDHFMAREGLFAASSLGASGVQTAMLEGNREALKILAEIRRRESRSDDAKLGDRRELLQVSPPVAEIVNAALSSKMTTAQVKEYVRYASGRNRPTLIFDLSDLDFGLKFNYVDGTLNSWQNDAKTYRAGAGFTEPRFWDPAYLNMLIYGKAALKYSGPTVDVDLTFGEKYFQPNSESNVDMKRLVEAMRRIDSGDVCKPPVPGVSADPDCDLVARSLDKLRPGKDATKIDLEIRMPLSRIMDNAPLADWGFGPMVKLSYETQLWPNILMSSIPPELWPLRVNDSRLLLGVTAKPPVGDEIFHLGGVLGYDISRTTPIQSLGAGIEIAGAGKWSLGIVNIKLESTLRKMFPVVVPEFGRMGLIWLTDGKIEVPIYGGFSVAALLNLTVGARMDDPWHLGTSTVFGIALSYGNRLKWLL